eukprot:9005828-Pyramimonas_sp.AAC.1
MPAPATAPARLTAAPNRPEVSFSSGGVHCPKPRHRVDVASHWALVSDTVRVQCQRDRRAALAP